MEIYKIQLDVVKNCWSVKRQNYYSSKVVEYENKRNQLHCLTNSMIMGDKGGDTLNSYYFAQNLADKFNRFCLNKIKTKTLFLKETGVC